MINYYPKRILKTIDILSLNWSNKTQYELIFLALKMLPLQKKHDLSPS